MLYSIEQVKQLVVDFLEKTPNSVSPYDIQERIDYSKMYNWIQNGVQLSDNVEPSGINTTNKEVYYFGKLIFCADNEGSSAVGEQDELEIYLNGGLVASAKTTLHQNQRSVDPIVFDEIFFDSLLFKNYNSVSSNSTLYFIGYKITM